MDFQKSVGTLDVHKCSYVLQIMIHSCTEVSSVFEVSAACDWWSVGVLLFELLTGKVRNLFLMFLFQI